MANNGPLRMSTTWNDDEMYKLFFNSVEGEILQNLPTDINQISLSSSLIGTFNGLDDTQIMQDTTENPIIFDSPLGSPGSDASFTPSSPEYSSDCASPTDGTVPMQTTNSNTVIDHNNNKIERKPEITKSNKKRRKVDVPEDDGVRTTPAGLTREQLLNFSSKDLEEYVQRLQATRKLTTEEQKELKRQRRIIKNREYAQLSRKKKKGYVSELEVRVQELEKENQELKSQVRALLQEKTNNSYNININNPMHPQPMQTVVPTKKSTDHGFFAIKRGQTAQISGACLLVVLLSFSLYFVMPNTIGGVNVKTEGYTTSRVLLDEGQTTWYDWISQTLASFRVKSHKRLKEENMKTVTMKRQSSQENLKSYESTNNNNEQCKCNNYKEGGIQIEYSPKCCTPKD